MAVTADILQWLLDGGKGIEEFKLLANAMDTMSDAVKVFDMHREHLASGLDVRSSSNEMCALAHTILARRAVAREHCFRDPLEPVFYVYHHIGRKSGEVFYVGKGREARCTTKKGRSPRWQRRVQAEGGFDYRIVRNGMTEADALAFESEEIQRCLTIYELENVRGVAL